MIEQEEQPQGTLRKQRQRFVMSPTHLFTNPQISAIAKTLWQVLESKPDHWRFFWSEILKHFKEGRNAVKKSMKELENFGYVKKRKAKKGNIFCGMDIDVFYDPSLPFDEENQGSARMTENGSPGNQSAENGPAENGSTYKKIPNQKLLKKKELTLGQVFSEEKVWTAEALTEAVNNKNAKKIFNEYAHGLAVQPLAEKFLMWREDAKMEAVKNMPGAFLGWVKNRKGESNDNTKKDLQGKKFSLESPEIIELRSNIKFFVSNEGSFQDCQYFTARPIEKTEAGYKIIVSDPKALKYEEVLKNIVKIEIK